MSVNPNNAVHRRTAGRFIAISPRVAWPLLALAIYLAGALVTQHNALDHFGSGCACSGTDPTLFFWSMAWWPHALLHLPHNPFVTQEIWTPGGLNLANNTATPTLALLGIPITAVAGPVATYNVWSILAPVTGAFCAYRLCLALTARQGASIAAGWLYGFSTYAVTQLLGHLHLVFTFAAPALALLFLRRIDGSISRRRFITLTFCVLLAQMGISTEMLATVTLAGVIGLIATAIFIPPDRRRALTGPLPEMIAAYLITAIVASPFLYFVLKGPAPNVVANPSDVGADLLSFIVPPPTTWLGGSSYAHTTAQFLTNTAENNAYLGFPLIAIILATALRLRRDWRIRALIATTVVFFIWSLGGHLHVKGVESIRLPWSPFAHHTVFNDALPVRIAGYTALAAALATALWLADRRVWLPVRWALFLAAAVFLFPNPNAPEYDVQYPVPAFFTNGSYRHYIAPDEVVLPLPFSTNGYSLLWQAKTHFAFRLASGDFTIPTPYLHEPATATLLDLPPATPQADAGILRTFLIQHKVGAVVIQDGTAPGWAGVLTSLGVQGTETGGVDVFRLPAGL